MPLDDIISSTVTIDDDKDGQRLYDRGSHHHHYHPHHHGHVLRLILVLMDLGVAKRLGPSSTIDAR